METVLQIKIDKTILHDVENYAEKMNISVSDLIGDYLLHISKYSLNKHVNVVRSYQELVEALEAGMEDILQGQSYTHNEMKEHWEKKIGKNASL